MVLFFYYIVLSYGISVFIIVSFLICSVSIFFILKQSINLFIFILPA
ncbi:hypothetical protein LEP1GSC082_0839 [Leptospira kirschneri str. H2]|uniref:Uncharacterized protein n=2 Tax=Leptospira kirschneri TaxID=29507 RepID=A0A0E2AYB4_9LEPT|nr:hypothetical protein LEP1GSC081_3100 [Leptospira kirschneri str. H1]EKO59089.1 hypothetical protein LEP1GSC082_0839 [Leptospira kirschneri str. H2]EMK24877.1 hypothetical protein LEP1GSC008_0608 [Leptospira kirschneri serovar Bulgarica str. Nikolaevo]